MSVLFCTACGYRVSFGSAFCEECGVVFSDKIEPSTGETSKASNHPSSPPWMTWLDVGGKSFGLGAPLAAVFDFLSPRVALLPFAATIALVGLVTALALRKFVAPNLPATSKLRLVLAPEAGLHRSRLMIGTGLLSVLMVTGAAWSNANAPEGGVIASKFDAARVAQMQLGILQAMQKEQRQQTAVLEDIREGRATDPRRELGNIGGGFNGSQLDSALDKGDSRTVRLLLAGGLKWRVSSAYVAYESGDSKMPALLLENMAGFELRAKDCENLITEKFGSTELNLSSINGASPQILPDMVGKPSEKLQTFQKIFMKTFCATPAVQQFVKSKILVLQQGQQKSTRSRSLCIQNKTAARASTLESQKIRKRFNIELCASSDCSFSFDRLISSAHDEKQYAQVVQEVCTEEFPLGSNSETGKVLDLSSTYQQLLDSIS